MSDATRTPGTVAWHDLTVSEVRTVATFYRDVLGMTLEPVPMGGYWDFNLVPGPGRDPVAGVCHARGANAGLPPAWLAYFVVDDLESSLAACQRHGGTVLTGPSRGSSGAVAVVEDPAGAVVALWENGEADGAGTGDGADAGDGGIAAESIHAPASSPMSPARLEEMALVALIVASGGEGSISGSALDAILRWLTDRFQDVDAVHRFDAFARAVARFEKASVTTFSTSVAELGRELSAPERTAAFCDLQRVAEADGVVHAVERTLLRYVADAWKISFSTDDTLEASDA